jgi:XTP/dITP diphosphohydrolase
LPGTDRRAADPLVIALLLATTNPHKIDEIRGILRGMPARFHTLAEFPDVEAPEETGVTFAENARAKATHYARTTGLLTVAEDSGLEIPLLGGAPGVYSARFNGETYPEKFAALYDQLGKLGAREAAARYVAAIALARNGDVIFEASGTTDGIIAPAARGSGGFGYDPIFFYPPFQQTMAQLSPERKAEVSHRGHAFRALRHFLETNPSLAI